MDKNRNRLKFDTVDHTVQILFANGRETIPFGTKCEALEAVIDCCEKDKISETELDMFIKEILSMQRFFPDDGVMVMCISISVHKI